MFFPALWIYFLFPGSAKLAWLLCFLSCYFLSCHLFIVAIMEYKVWHRKTSLGGQTQMGLHRCLRKHFLCCWERPLSVSAYASFTGSALPASRQEMQQSGFEKLLLSTSSEMVLYLWEALGSSASAQSSEHPCSVWGKFCLYKVSNAALYHCAWWDSQIALSSDCCSSSSGLFLLISLFFFAYLAIGSYLLNM